MEIIETSAKEYGQLVGTSVPVFSRHPFLELNEDKVDKVHYLIGKDSKNRVAFAIGEKDGEWKAPYSAPFSNIVLLRKETSVEALWDFVGALVKYVKRKNGKSINIYLPADIYGAADNSRILNALLGNGFHIQFLDVNYSFDLLSFEMENYESILHYNARKNLRIARKASLSFVRCESDEQKIEAYETIRINREYRGFPLRMTRNQVMDTIKIVDHDFFLVQHEGKTIASAVVYLLTPKIAQVVYWGDVPEVGEFKPINFIAYNLIQYYKAKNFEILDIGISTEEGIPNYGLCSFKESLGCIPSCKYRVQIDL